MNTPTLTTARLLLRAFTEQDAGPLHRILNEKDILRYFPNPDPPSRERVQQVIARQLAHWAEHGYGWWAVERRSQAGLLGWCGLQFLPETGETEVSYLLDKACWGQGLATEAALASLQFGFETLGLECIIGIVHPENEASIQVIEKIGMSLVDRNTYFGMDVYRYSKTRECEAQKHQLRPGRVLRDPRGRAGQVPLPLRAPGGGKTLFSA